MRRVQWSAPSRRRVSVIASGTEGQYRLEQPVDIDPRAAVIDDGRADRYLSLYRRARWCG